MTATVGKRNSARRARSFQMNANTSRRPEVPAEGSTLEGETARRRRPTTSPANTNAATVTKIANPTPYAAIRRPASGAPRR